MTWGSDLPDRLLSAVEEAAEYEALSAVAVIDGGQTWLRRSVAAPTDGRFEIGSIAKTMTATLLCVLAADGLVGLEDRVDGWLEAGDNGDITLSQLASHTSGLPRLAPNFAAGAADPANPYAGYTAALAEEGLRLAERGPSGVHNYSNFGFQLLGLVLERAADCRYGVLLRDRLLSPLSMTCSGVAGSGLGARVAGRVHGMVVSHWDQPLPGAGGVEATIDDLARYASVCLRPSADQLGSAIATAQSPVVGVDEHLERGLGWSIRDRRFLSHSGGTGGFSSAVVLDPDRDRAVVVLASAGQVTDRLEAAAYLAINGRDPHAAQPEAVGEEWAERAREIVQLLVNGRAGDVHSLMAAPFQQQVSLKQLARAWRLATIGAGPADDIDIACRRIAAGIAADITINFRRRPQRLTLAFGATGTISGLKILRPDERPPW